MLVQRSERRERPATGSEDGGERGPLTLYKVHKYTLALHCSVFASLFNGPRDALEAGSERYKGIPVMDLPDMEEDVRDFLKALYFPSETSRHRHVSSPFRESDTHWAVFPNSYGGILRLSAKYEASIIRNLIVEVLEMEWPDNFEVWSALQATMRDTIDVVLSRNTSGDLTPYYPDPVLAIRLAVDYSIPRVLPMAYYDLMRLLNDDEYIHNPDLARPRRAVNRISALKNDEVQKVIVGRTLLQKMFHKYLSVFRIPYLPECDGSCEDTVQSWYKGLMAEFRHMESDPFLWIHNALELCESDSDTVECGNCIEWRSQQLRRMNHDLWRGLPSYFGLPGILSIWK
ncbi:hypothetical protein BV25DRAFT_1719986 [Artomyces pyxidatus]|uniref:Uncharacterized protein n=1 Tax=Artomyces pyxidatus TaxID=48021 RepID=A0ACB8SH99_9AGAM|nr:hypothetical protein BV25DRAFT_1719986 [Artomyces pyxidatus]